MIPVVPLIILSLLISSCLSIDAKFNIASDGSGVLDLHYEVSQYAAHVGRVDGDQNLVMFPLERSDFEEASMRIGGLEIVEYSKKETEDNTIIDVRIRFDSIENVSRLFSTQDIREPMTIEQDGQRRKLRFFLYQGSAEAPSQDLVTLYTNLFKGDAIKISCTFPSSISSVSSGQILADRKSALLLVPVMDTVIKTEPLV